MAVSYGSFHKFDGKESVGFYPNTAERFFLAVLFQNQQKDRRFL